MQRRFLMIVPALASALAFGTAQASAGSLPFDAASGLTSTAPAAVFPTLPFALGEIDLAILGVPDAELATAGLAGAEANSYQDDPTTLVVDDDRVQCPNAQFTSIQAAVDVAQPGDRIKVCPGTYTEQVRVKTDDVTLYSSAPLQAIIRAPMLMTYPNSIVLVQDARNVAIQRFTIKGPFDFGACAGLLDRHTGVRVINGSAIVYGNHITEIRDVNPALRGCQDGIGVLVGRNFELQTGIAAIRNNLIDLYQKGGIVVDNTGSYATIAQNEIDGDPNLSSVTAQNGVQVGRGAGADVDHNQISDNFYCCNTAGDTAAGVLLFETSANVDIEKNDVFRNGVGIDIDEGTVGLEIANNRVRQNRNNGVAAYTDAHHNEIERNKAFDNTPVDCFDDTHGNGTAGTDNYWNHDQGNTESPPGLCKRGGDRD